MAFPDTEPRSTMPVGGEPQPPAANRGGLSGARRLGTACGVLVLLGVLGTGGFMSLRAPGDAAPVGETISCPTSDWQTTVTLDQSRPELAMTTLRSRNQIGPAGSESCVEVSLACLHEGPYFEVRLASPALGISEVGPLRIRSLNDEMAAQVFQPGDGNDNAVRIADKPAVELIAYALSNSLGFRVPITFASGETGLAEFRSYHFSSAARPVLFACNMRSLQGERPPGSDDGGE